MNKFSLFLALTTTLSLCAAPRKQCSASASTSTQAATQGVIANPSVAELKKHLASKNVVLVDIYATWCGPCKQMLPIIDKLAADSTLTNVVIIKIEHDKTDLIKVLPGVGAITSVPSFFIFKDGEIVDKFNGSMAQDKLKQKIKKYTGA